MTNKELTRNYPLWTALITPMNRDYSIDFESLKKIVKMQEAAGNGILLVGSTGEGLNLTLEEKKAVVEAVISYNPKVPLMVGVGGAMINDQVEWIKYLNKLPITAYLLTTPLYAKPGRIGQTEWFKKLLDVSKKPCMLYNIPGRTGVKLHFEAFRELCKHKNTWALKDASGDVDTFKNFVDIAEGRVDVFSGDDGMVPQFAPVGCKGLVSVASNLWPEATKLYVQKTLGGALLPKEADWWEHWSGTLFLASNPIPVKVAAAHLGLISTNTLRLPLIADDLESLEPIIQADISVNEWRKM